MALYPKSTVGIGFCDRCDMRIFADENYYVIKKRVLCNDCLEEMDEHECDNKRD